MSGAIRDTEKLIQRQIETSKRRGERELKTMENNHQNYKADIKKSHDVEIVDLQHGHHKNLTTAAEKKEKLLEEMKTHLHQTQELTEKQLKDLKVSTEREKNAIQQKYSHDRERITGEHELYLEELNHRFNQSNRKVNHDGKLRVEETKLSKNQELDQVQSEGQEKISTQTENFSTRFKKEGLNYQKLKDDQDLQFKKERLTTNQRQQIEMNKMTTGHMDHIEIKDDNYRKGLKDQELFFEKKYGNQLVRHNDEFKVLDAKNKKVLDDLKTGLTKEIAKVASRNDDPFFKFETLKPRFKTLENHIQIEVEIPEHSKQDVQLTTNGKEAIVSFTRRFADAAKEVSGTINKVNKVESFTTRLQTGHFLDGKSMKSSYENGVMTYTIKKA